VKLFINLTPCIPLSTLGEGDDIKKRGFAPLFNIFPLSRVERGIQGVRLIKISLFP